MQRVLLDIHIMMLLAELLVQDFLEIAKICESKFPCKIRDPIKRSRILLLATLTF